MPVEAVGWYPWHVGDEEDYSPDDLVKPSALASVVETHCRCGQPGWWGDLEENLLSPVAFYHEVMPRSFLSKRSLPDVRSLLEEASGSALRSPVVLDWRGRPEPPERVLLRELRSRDLFSLAGPARL